MKLLSVIVFSMYVFLLMSLMGYAREEEEFTGTLESRPKSNAGTWIIGGRQVDATDETKVEAEYGPIVVGGCVVVEYEGKLVKYIKSEEKHKCSQ